VEVELEGEAVKIRKPTCNTGIKKKVIIRLVNSEYRRRKLKREGVFELELDTV